MNGVTRIVAGRVGGRRITVPPRGTRPTSERVREAVFSAVAARIELDGARVLDLYAGSGALGIEALSRGAAHALFVESDKRAAAVLRENLRSLDLPGQVRAATVASTVAASTVAGPDADGYDLVLADPPYATPAAEVTAVIDALAGNGWLRPGALLVVERAARDGEIAWPGGVEPITTRRYGDTLVCYGRRP
jgi:16S rRNA (guanine966-N2)-methyltransferase